MSMAPSIELLTFFQLPKISPAFLNWKRQDQLLLSWIILTLIEGIHAQIVGLTTSQEVWTALERSFFESLTSTYNATATPIADHQEGILADYFKQAKNIVDHHTAVGKPVSNDDLILHILGELPPSIIRFRPMTTKSDPITLNAPYGMLLSQEIRLSDQHYMLDIGSPSANLATTQNNSRRGRGSQFLNRGRGGHVRGP
ncbi:hypothetical protein AMTR_s00070p00098410, partial [Amborella trichopoda]